MDNELQHHYRSLLRSCFQGVLASHSQQQQGYPAGSLVAYVCDHSDRPVLLLSRLAQHTRNLRANPQVSLTVWTEGVLDFQNAARLNLLANVECLNKTTAQHELERYLRHYPQASEYLQLDFDAYRLQPVAAHFVAGFARVHWLSADQLSLAGLDYADETALLTELPQHHAQALSQFVDCGDDRSWRLVGIDTLGITILLSQRLQRRPFPQPFKSAQQIQAFFAAAP